MTCMRSMETLGYTLEALCSLDMGRQTVCRRNKNKKGFIDCRGGWRSTMVTLYVILYWGANFHCWWVRHVSGKTREKWVWFELPVHKIRSDVLFFDQGSFFCWGQIFGTLPNGKVAWRSLQKTSAGIFVQEIPRIHTRYPWWYGGVGYMIGRSPWTIHPQNTRIVWT